MKKSDQLAKIMPKYFGKTKCIVEMPASFEEYLDAKDKQIAELKTNLKDLTDSYNQLINQEDEIAELKEKLDRIKKWYDTADIELKSEVKLKKILTDK